MLGNKTNSGFTLIEIMIVIFIIGIAATFAVLNLGNITHARRIEEVAKELALLLPAAETQAILQPAVIGVRITDNDYQFFQFVIDNNTRVASWKLIQRDRLLQTRPIAPDVAVTLANQEKSNLIPEEEQATQPQLIFLPSGDITPFNIIIGGKDEPAKYQLVGAANGEIKLIKLTTQKK